MPTIVDHDLMLTLLTEEFEALEQWCSGLTAAQWDSPTCLPGWTVRDNLSHIIGTESMLLQVPNPEVTVPELAYVKNAIGSANEVWVESMRSLSGADMIERLHDVTAQRLAALGAMTQADFDAPSWTPAGPNETYGRFMRIRHFDCFLHEHDMRSAVGASDRPDPAHVASALDEVATGLGFIVGKRAGLPTGSRVRIVLTGPVSRDYFISVDERAAVVDALDGPPTVEIELPAMAFLRLTGGREQAGAHIDKDVLLRGDRALATQLAEHLAFTI
jgi:uncharacterized protein (TIGR03083 family)